MYKIRNDSEHAKQMSKLFKGQPNIYAQFMALGAGLLKDGGQIVAITPRSYCNGLYFKGFRKYFLNIVKLNKIHIFESRKKAFGSDGVLQENIIVCAERTKALPEFITISSSNGHDDIFNSDKKIIPAKDIFYKSEDDIFIRILSNTEMVESSKLIDSFGHTFTSLGYKISTGPIVSFRQKRALTNRDENDTAPLISIHNVKPFEVLFNKKNTEQNYIRFNACSKSFLVPNKTYVLIRRFSAKDDKRRLLSAVLKSNQINSKFLAFENHLNYIYKVNGELTENEAYGLAALLNSQLYDLYFRAISGNTQVNANEIKYIKLPSTKIIEKIGSLIKSLSCAELNQTEHIVQGQINEN